MVHFRLNAARWSLAFFLLASLVVGCGREETGGVSENSAKPAVEPVADQTVADFETKSEQTKSERELIYDVEADGAELIAAAVGRARREHKRVLIEWGGNWCGWCYKLHDVFKSDDRVHPILLEDYELVLVDCGTNRELMESYGGKDRQYSFPHLTILDADGSVLVNQNTEPLEVGSQHDPAKVAEFLEEWKPEPADAEVLLASALEQATQEDKRVLVHVGTPYCGWCGVLGRFLHEHEALLSDDYIDLKIDTRRMTHGVEVAQRYQPNESLGVPWMVILDASGKVLTTSVGPKGNCGYPYLPEEIDHFIGMFKATSRHMSEEDLSVIRAALVAFRNQRDGE